MVLYWNHPHETAWRSARWGRWNGRHGKALRAPAQLRWVGAAGIVKSPGRRGSQGLTKGGHPAMAHVTVPECLT
jgi:hypothetical protein